MNRRQFVIEGVGASQARGVGIASTALTGKEIPSSGERVPVIGVGTNRYGVGEGGAERTLLQAALARFHELGAALGRMPDAALRQRQEAFFDAL